MSSLYSDAVPTLPAASVDALSRGLDFDHVAQSRFGRTIAAFDAANAKDPNQDQDESGITHPRELLYSWRMSECLATYRPDTPEPLRLAARAQHLCRWTIPRTDYPAGRRGYYNWRNDLKAFHAATAADIMRDAGYADAPIERVRTLLTKSDLKSDSDVQCLEDVICLVFLQHYCVEFARLHADDKVIDILQKTWKKMSPSGRDAALALSLPAPTQALVEQALA